MAQYPEKPGNKTQADIRTMIEDARTCMFSTFDEDSARIKSRPMSIAEVDAANQIWFFTNEASHKIQEIRNSWQVALGFANGAAGEWISVNGHARLVKDKGKIQQLWKPTYKAWFPNGLDTPTLALLCVEMETAEYWESKGGPIVTAFEMIKAAITGDPARNSEHDVVSM